MGPNDTIPVLVYHIDNDSFPYKYGEWVTVIGKLTEGAKIKIKERRRMERYVDSTYPMAIQAADLVNEIRREKLEMTSGKAKRKLVKSKEREN